MSIRPMQDLLVRERGDRQRPEIAEESLSVVDGDVDFSAEDVRNHEHVLTRPPLDGLKLRTHAAALGLSWVKVLAALGYWPPLGESTPGPPPAAVNRTVKNFPPPVTAAPTGDLDALKAFCSGRGITVSEWNPVSKRAVIQL